MKSPSAIASKPDLENSRFYMGNVMSFLLRGSNTGGRLSIVEAACRAGNEPPPHVHLWEDEIYYVLEGSVEFFVEGEQNTLCASAGGLVFLPHDKAHAFSIRSETFRTLLMVQSVNDHSVGLDTYFWESSEPARSMSLPEHATTYAMSDPDEIKAASDLGKRLGTVLLSSEEAAQRLSNYRGFGASVAK